MRLPELTTVEEKNYAALINLLVPKLTLNVSQDKEWIFSFWGRGNSCSIPISFGYIFPISFSYIVGLHAFFVFLSLLFFASATYILFLTCFPCPVSSREAFIEHQRKKAADRQTTADRELALKESIPAQAGVRDQALEIPVTEPAEL